MRARTILLVLALAALAAGCPRADGPPATRDGPTITVASFNFPESQVVAEIYAQVLESEGFRVDRRMNLGSREVTFPALRTGEIDLMPEYIGSALGVAYGGEPTADADATFADLRDAFAADGIVLLAMSPAQSQNAYVVTPEFATQHGLTSIADLANVDRTVVMGGPPECEARLTCFRGFTEVYGLTNMDFVALDVAGAITINALEQGEIDVAVLFSTQPIIEARDWVVLDDPEGIVPAENIAAAVSGDVADAYGDDLRDVLEQVARELTTEDLRRMNAEMEVDLRDPPDVARDWLEEKGLLRS